MPTPSLDDILAISNRRRAEVEELRAENTKLSDAFGACSVEVVALRAENERLLTALEQITELDLEGDASLADAIGIADEAINPSPA